MSGREVRSELIAFLETVSRPDRSLDGVGDDVDLFDAGIVDSLAAVRIVTYLEEHHGIDLIDAGVDPAELSSVERILKIIERGR